MTPDLKTNASFGITPLVTGIIKDAQTLISQQLALFQSELKEDLGRAKTAAIPLLIGAAVWMLAGIFLFTMVAQLLVYLWPELPQFAAFGIVGAALAIAGTTLVLVAKAKTDEMTPFPQKSAEALKENIQWTTKT